MSKELIDFGTCAVLVEAEKSRVVLVTEDNIFKFEGEALNRLRDALNDKVRGGGAFSPSA